jgi:hypothetical protein
MSHKMVRNDRMTENDREKKGYDELIHYFAPLEWW